MRFWGAVVVLATVGGCTSRSDIEMVAGRRTDAFHCAATNGRCYPAVFFAMFERFGTPRRETQARRVAWCTRPTRAGFVIVSDMPMSDSGPRDPDADLRCFSSDDACETGRREKPGSTLGGIVDSPCEEQTVADVQLYEFVDLGLMKYLVESAAEAPASSRRLPGPTGD